MHLQHQLRSLCETIRHTELLLQGYSFYKDGELVLFEEVAFLESFAQFFAREGSTFEKGRPIKLASSVAA